VVWGFNSLGFVAGGSGGGHAIIMLFGKNR
jgi:hypothetical protein